MTQQLNNNITLFITILFKHKKKENLAICNNINGSGRHYDKLNKSEKGEFCIMYDLIYMWNEKKPGLIEMWVNCCWKQG